MASQPTALLDSLTLGNDDSEQQHTLKSDRSEIYHGALDLSARRLLPGEPGSWQGGTLAFKMKVDPGAHNYLTARFWGSEVNENYLILFCEGKQLGYRHLGDIDVLTPGAEEPRYNGRFYYVTTPLPLEMTKGKTELAFEIRATGHIWGYGTSFDQYQKPMTTPSGAVYRLYTHTDGCFVPPTDDKQGNAPPETRRPAPGPEVLATVKGRVNGFLRGALDGGKPVNQMQIEFIARACLTKWTVTHDEPKALDLVARSVDALYAAWKQNPKLLEDDKATWNPGWFGFGPAADGVRLIAGKLGAALDQEIDNGTGGKIVRRAAWSEMFGASRDWLRYHRRQITNQTMIVDTNIYLSNRGVAAVDPAKAMPEEVASRYLYEAVGLQPWLGSDTDHGPTKEWGGDYYQVTPGGLSKEPGFVGIYGEGGVAGMVAIYDATREPDGEGDAKLKAQLIKMERARRPFRYPLADGDNYRAMQAETVIGGRDTHFPGGVVYAQRPSWEQSAIHGPAATLDPVLLGDVQQMFADNQFFVGVQSAVGDHNFRALTGLLDVPDDYEKVTAQPASPHRLPLSWDQPDAVFSDVDDAVVAIKNGEEILYVSLYWRANFAVNFLARTHYLTPRYQQVAVVHEDTQFQDSGLTYKRSDWINWGFGNGGTQIHYPADIHQAYAGQVLPIAKVPADVSYKPSEGSSYAGRGDFYTLRYGSYLIGMNTTRDQTFQLKIPAEFAASKDLVSGRPITLKAELPVEPGTTRVFYRKVDGADAH